MAANRGAIPLLVGMMLLTGVCNTLLTKYQDMQCVRNCDDPNPKHRKPFEQPVLQTLQMFVGEMGCWLVVAGTALYRRYISSRKPTSQAGGGYQPVGGTALDNEEDDDVTIRPYQEDINPTTIHAEPLAKPHPSAASPPGSVVGARTPLTGAKVVLLALPACCDIAGTTLMNVGLLFVAASIYQMTRGALVLFVGIFSVWFLRRRLGFAKWLALFIVVAGVAIVGLAGIVEAGERKPIEPTVPGTEDGHGGLKAPAVLMADMVKRAAEELKSQEAFNTVIGILCIAGAQVFTATQFVLEESIMHQYELDPIRVVGYEGTFGFLVTLLGMVILHFVVGRTDAGRYGYFDAREGFRELLHYRAIAVSSVMIMISIGGFNFFGLSVTRSVSATARSTIDTCRTLGIWLVSLGLGWESFKWLQVVGFVLLVYGTFLFNDLVQLPQWNWGRRRQAAPLFVSDEHD